MDGPNGGGLFCHWISVVFCRDILLNHCSWVQSTSFVVEGRIGFSLGWNKELAVFIMGGALPVFYLCRFHPTLLWHFKNMQSLPEFLMPYLMFVSYAFCSYPFFGCAYAS